MGAAPGRPRVRDGGLRSRGHKGYGRMSERRRAEGRIDRDGRFLLPVDRVLPVSFRGGPRPPSFFVRRPSTKVLDGGRGGWRARPGLVHGDFPVDDRPIGAENRHADNLIEILGESRILFVYRRLSTFDVLHLLTHSTMSRVCPPSELPAAAPGRRSFFAPIARLRPAALPRGRATGAGGRGVGRQAASSR